MPFPNPDTQFKKGQSGNPNGVPKGTKHLSTWIQELLNDDKFETVVTDAKQGIVEYKGAPLKALIHAQLHLALHSKDESIRIKAADLLYKHGYGTKQILSNDPENPLSIGMTQQQAEQLINLRAKRGSD